MNCGGFWRLLRHQIFQVLYDTLWFQIRLFTRSCNGRAACNCAVAVKSGDDVILFDRCGPEQQAADSRPIEVHMLVNGELTAGTHVVRKEDGKTYEVCSFCLWFLIHLSYIRTCVISHVCQQFKWFSLLKGEIPTYEISSRKKCRHGFRHLQNDFFQTVCSDIQY